MYDTRYGKDLFPKTRIYTFHYLDKNAFNCYSCGDSSPSVKHEGSWKVREHWERGNADHEKKGLVAKVHKKLDSNQQEENSREKARHHMENIK